MGDSILCSHWKSHIPSSYLQSYFWTLFLCIFRQYVKNDIYIGYCVGDFMDQSWKHFSTSTYIVLACSQLHDFCQPKGKLKNAIRLCDKTDLMNSQPLPHSQRGKKTNLKHSFLSCLSLESSNWALFLQRRSVRL